MKSNSKQIGKLYAMIHSGSVVINRKSLKIDVPYKHWDKNNRRVKSSNPDSNQINNLIDEKIREFEIENQEIPTGNDLECALKYMKSRLNSPSLTTGSKSKYKTILKNFESVVYEELKMDSLPFKQLRDIKFIQILKNEIRKGRKGTNKFKSNSSWFNYMTVFGGFVKDWNKNSGTQFPINILPFTSDIGKFTKKIACTLTHKELRALTEYEPINSRNKEAQLLSKNIFLFQYHTGGIRIQDALTLTNKEIKSNGFQIRIKKTNEIELFPFCYEQVECLKRYYPFEYNISLKSSEIGNINLHPSMIIQLNRMDGIGEINKLTLNDVSEIRALVIKQSIEHNELKELVETLFELEELLKEEITKTFFDLLRKRPQSFILPKLDWDDFKESYTNTDNRTHNERHEYLIHCARSGQISNLKRIADNLGIEKMSGHTPRHTLANHLQEEGYSVEEIQKVLVHSNINTTKIYLKRRHHTDVVNKTVSESTKVFRKKRNQDFHRGY
jgi:site-specific recombinase XerD